MINMEDHTQQTQDTRTSVANEPSGSGACGGAAPIFEVVLRQGQSHDDPSQLRANGRCARMCLSLDFHDVQTTQHVERLLSGHKDVDEESWATMRCLLCYSDGSEADLKPRGRHPDVIQVMDPNGTASSVASFRQGEFTMVSRTRLPKRRRVEGEEREEKKLEIKRYLSIMDVQSTHLETEVKIATNLTSRQHDGKIFFWKFFFSADLNDGHGEINAECRSREFEYVASKKVQHATKPRERKAAQPRRPRQYQDDFIEEDEEEDIGMHSVSPHVPHLPYAPKLRQRSSRQCAEATRRTLKAIADDGALDDNPAATWVGKRDRSMYTALPAKCQQRMISGTVIDDEKIMLGKKKGGLNLCRVESIDRLCDGMYSTPTPESQHNLLDTSEPAVASLRESDEAAMSALGLDLLRESPELLGSVGLEKCNSSEALLNDTLLLDRCESSTRLLKVPSKEELVHGSATEAPQLVKSASMFSLGSMDFPVDANAMDVDITAADDAAASDGSTDVLQSA